MKLRYLSLFTLAAMALSLTASDYDLQKPFGFCTCSSRTSNVAYNITGGGCYEYPVTGVSSVITLTSTGADMMKTISDAIKKYDVIVLDGSKGDFIISSVMSFNGISGKTVLGINGARLCTQWYVTQEIIDALDAAGVPSMSTSSGTGGTLSNGSSVSEEAEFKTRQIIINLTDDNNEIYRKSGIFYFKSCKNLIIRNLKFVGPGSIDVGGSDLISFYGTTNCWVDHCEFSDGMDGNFDITQKSDFNTVSWCTFNYSSRSYIHQNTNLIGSSDSESTGYLNTTFAFNWWGTGCKQRMPMARVGKIHMLNNYFTCSGSSTCINPRKNSEFLIEGNYFAKGVKKYYSESSATAVTWSSNNYIAESSGNKLPSSKGSTVTVPYGYTAASYAIVPDAVSSHAGATLYIFGDANGDRQITITDAVAIVNYILDNASEGFVSSNADVNHDGQITISDAVGVVNIILNK